MPISDLIKMLFLCKPDSDHGYSIPPDCYADDTIADFEINRIFRESWIGVGRSDMVQEYGDYIALDIAKQHLILLRDKSGVLRAFANSCRHRGARLLDGSGNCRGIRCPFHSWTYSLNGRLAAAPKMDILPDFDEELYGLIPYRVREKDGFAFVCMNPDAPKLESVLGDFFDFHSPWQLDRLVTTRRRELQVNCNWKAFLDVFNEYYHLPFVHRDSIDDLYNPPESADITKGQYASQFGVTRGTGALLQTDQEKALPIIPGMPGKEATGVRYTWVFPNMTFAAGMDSLWMYEAYPIGASRCHVVQTSCFPPETLELSDANAKIEAYYERLDAALDEDITALVNQQRGLECPDSRQGRFQPLMESNVAAFARWYAERMIVN